MLSIQVPVVLLADDDDSIRKFLRYVLEHDGYQIIECADGDAAVAACRQQLPDAVLLDIRMPTLDGITACEQIQHLPGGQQVPVLMITALDDHASIDRCFEAGASDYITKPINRAILRQRVRRLVRVRQTEDALRSSEQKYRSVFEATNDALLIIDVTTGRILDANPAACGLFERTGAELADSTLSDLSAEPDQTALTLQQRLEHVPRRYYKKRDGTPFPTEVTVSYYTQAGRELCTTAIRDITHRQHMEDALRESEARYRQMFEQNQAVQFLIGPDTGQIIQANPAAARFYGYPVETLQGMRISDINQLAPGQVSGAMQAALSEQRNAFVFPHRLASGEIRQVEVHSSPIDLRGQRVLYSIIHDITERQQAEDALRDSEARFRLLADHAPVLIWMAGTDTLCTFFNRPWLDFTGHPFEQELGNGWAAGVHPDDFQRCLATYLAAFKVRQPFRMEYRLRRADGVYRWVIDNGLPLSTSSGLFTGYIGSCFDITEIKEAHAEVERLARHNQLILTSAGEGILGLDEQGDHIFVNPAAAAMLGYEVPELIGRHSHSTWHHTRSDGTPYPEEECPIYAAFRDGVVHRGTDEVFWRKDATSFPVEYVSTPMREGDRLTGAVVVFSDITARKHVENEIARLYLAEQSQRQLAEALRDTAAQLNNTLNLDEVLDRVLDNVGRVVPHDGAHVILAEEGVAHLVRNRGYGLLTPTQRPAPLRLVNEILPLREMADTGQPLVIRDTRDYTGWGDMGNMMQLQSVLSAPVVFKQQTLGYLILMSGEPGFFTDTHAARLRVFADQAAIAIENARLYLAERQQFDRWQQAQSRLAQSEKLAALGRLAAALTHEINNPLQAIQSYLELIMDFPSEASERQEFLQVVRQEINRLSQLTRNVLNFARPTPGPRHSASIDGLIQQTLALAGKQLEHSHIQVTADLQPTPRVFVATEQMTQVFLNLVLNAIEAIHQNGQIHITTHVERSQVVIRFINDGPAIRQEDLPHIFEPFFTTKADGTGLGLSISHRLVQQHDGSLIVENVTETRGVVFTIRLPVMQTSELAHDVDLSATEH